MFLTLYLSLMTIIRERKKTISYLCVILLSRISGKGTIFTLFVSHLLVKLPMPYRILYLLVWWGEWVDVEIYDFPYLGSQQKNINKLRLFYSHFTYMYCYNCSGYQNVSHLFS